MSFLLQYPNTTFINVKLTDTGRRLLSEGKLAYKKVVYSDREIDYNIDRSGLNDLFFNRVMAPKDDQPRLPPTNFDGTPAIDISSNLFSGTFVVTADCQSRGFYSARTQAIATGGTIPSVRDLMISSEFRLGVANTNATNFDGTNVVTLTSSSYSPPEGTLAFVVFSNPAVNGSANITSDAPFAALWYRVTGDTSSLTADREFPDFSAAVNNPSSQIHFYPWNGIRQCYGSAITVDCKVWNMNIVRTSSEIGTELGVSGYTAYGSTDYNGQKHFFGFDNHYRQIGFIHFTNEYTGNTYQEQFVPGSFEMDLPHLLWHRHPSNPGEGEHGGHRFLDRGSDVFFDEASQTTYTLLKDDESSDAWVVGRVYQKLKLAVITDPELLTALTYKSNRNWTLPPLNLSPRPTPRTGLTINDVAGCLQADKTYYVTYGVFLDSGFGSSSAFGYKNFYPCSYIQKITGSTDDDGYSPYLSATFPARAFPYMRDSVGMTAYSGTGWNANTMHILMKEINTDDDTGVDNVGSDGWKLLIGGGYYEGGEDGAATINPSYAITHEFVVDASDLETGFTYSRSSFFNDNNIDYRLSGNTIDMNIGNEAFFFGNIKVATMKTTYKTVISLQATNEQHNESENLTFNPDVDESVYITEIGVLDDQNRLVAVGKPTNPIKKNDSTFLTLQLEMDF